MQNIFDKLSLENTQNIYFYKKNINIEILPLRVNKSLHEMKISPHSIFIIDSKPIILFFSQTPKINEIFKQCWNFSESPIIIVENELDFNIYSGYGFKIENGEFLLNILDKNDLNYISIMNGSYINKLNIKYQQKRVDKILLENIQAARLKLLDMKLDKNLVNSLLGRIIFIRYLVDREVSLNYKNEYSKNEKQKLSKNDLINILSDKNETYTLFKYLKSKDGFNGDWFPLEKDEEAKVDLKHLTVLQQLVSGYDFKRNTGTLFDIYDFSIIPIEFISNVYESFIGEENQSKNGAYYTPTFLVDYILKYTVDKYFKEFPNEYNCKVLDPACGSGIFLVETLRKLVSQFEKVNHREIKPTEIIDLVKDNIFGIDKDKNATLISIFSLYLTMLDYQTPKDIEVFTFPYLLESEMNKNGNFFNDDFFNMNANYNEILKDKNINFIIGNPPYGASTIKNNDYVNKYILDNKLTIGNKDIVQPFMYRVKDFNGENTQIAFIVTSKVLYNLSSRKFRQEHFFNNFKVNHILELSSVRKEVFENADVPVSIIFYTQCFDRNEIFQNNINYISVKPNPFFSKTKSLFISKGDFKKVSQEKLLNDDYLWKTLIYGSYLDIKLIKKMKLSTSIQDILDTNSMLYKKGIKKKDGSRKINIESLMGFDFLDPKEELESFYISKTHKKWNTKEVGYIYREKEEIVEELYEPYSLLTTKGISQDLRLKSAISMQKMVFQDTIFAIKGDKEKLDILKSLLGSYNSSFFAYYMLLLGSSIGTEREQAHNIEKLLFPYIENERIISVVTRIEELKVSNHEKNYILTDNTYALRLRKLIEELDLEILNAFNLSKQEKLLVDYANKILIPWIIQKKFNYAFHKLTYLDEKLISYVNIIIDKYSDIYGKNNTYISAEIIYSNFAIGISFNILDYKPKDPIIWTEDNKINAFIKLSGKKSIDNLFIQKDIKGFTEKGFYIIKPNEYKNWHEIIAYLDFNEFDNAILKAGR